MKSIELKPTGTKNYFGNETYVLYVNGKKEYPLLSFSESHNEYGAEDFFKGVLDKIINVACSDYPNRLSMMNRTNIKLAGAVVDAIVLERQDKRFIVELSYFHNTAARKKMFWNYHHYLLAFHKTARKNGLKQIQKWSGIDWMEEMAIVVSYSSSLQGTIAQKTDIAMQLLKKTVAETEIELKKTAWHRAPLKKQN